MGPELQLRLLAAPDCPTKDQRYRIRRDGLWWDSRGWVKNEDMAMTMIGDATLQRELATHLAGIVVEVVNGNH